MFPDLFDIRDAFIVLSSSRSVGFGIGCIPLTEIESYIRLYDVEDIDRFIQLIRAMDGAFIQKVNQRTERKPKT